LIKAVALKIYKHKGQGHWIGSCVIVVTNSIEDATEMIRTELDAQGLEKENLNIKVFEIKERIIHINNGDY